MKRYHLHIINKNKLQENIEELMKLLSQGFNIHSYHKSIDEFDSYYILEL